MWALLQWPNVMSVMQAAARGGGSSAAGGVQDAGKQTAVQGGSQVEQVGVCRLVSSMG